MMIERSQNHLLPAVFPVQTRLSLATDGDNRPIAPKQPVPPAVIAPRAVPRNPFPRWEKGALLDYYT